MACVDKKELEEFKNFCEKNNIRDTFLNYIAWKDNFKIESEKKENE